MRRKALHYVKLGDGKVKCTLCPRGCVLAPGQTGSCRARRNINGELYTLVYGSLTAANVDPIEKKPLFHFWPGSTIFSISTFGCNLHCIFCQNFELSQVGEEEAIVKDMDPERVVKLAKRYGCKSIAFTYNEPVISHEFNLDVMKIAKKEGIYTVYVTNGYITSEALEEILPYLDAANVDLKCIDSEFYRKLCGIPDNTPIFEATKTMKEKGVHVEVTNLLIPGYNDREDQIRRLARWVVENLGPETPIHFSRFYPHYKMTETPPTPVTTIEKAREIAVNEGAYYVYVGNVPGHKGENTYCPSCGFTLVKRYGFEILEWKIKDGKCPNCGRKIEIVGEYVRTRYLTFLFF